MGIKKHNDYHHFIRQLNSASLVSMGYSVHEKGWRLRISHLAFELTLFSASYLMSNESDMKTAARRQLKSVEDPIEKLRLQCLTRGCCGIKDFARVFSIIDDNGVRKLDFEKFCQGTKEYGLQLTDQETKALFDSMDKNHSGFIDFDEFLVALRPAMSKNRLKIIEQAFRKLDKSGDGKITVDDLRDVYNAAVDHPKYKSGQMTEDEIFQEFLTNFEVGGKLDGVVTKDEFFNYYSGVSASIDNDAYFDLMMRNAWKL